VLLEGLPEIPLFHLPLIIAGKRLPGYGVKRK
jgi:hypothetical protein